MRRVLTTTDESHPDVPEGLTDVEAWGLPCVWQVYVDGTPFLGVPLGEDSWGEAKRHAAQILATGRYEYVDVRLVPDRRLSQRRTSTHPVTETPGWYGRRDSRANDRRQVPA